MITGLIHQGSGLGDQLFSYIATRTTAERLGVDFGFVGKEYFKGKDFIQLDWGKEVALLYYLERLSGKIVIDVSHKLFESKGYDPEFFFIEDGTVIDGTCLQDERYWNIEKVREWIKTEPLDMGDKVVMNIRGGEYRAIPELILPLSYWVTAANEIHTGEVKRNVEIHTDDLVYCKELFGETFPIIQDIALNWRSIRYAKYLILSNSAFGILPALLNENVKEVIAPHYWARRNTKTWSMPSNYYKKFTYI